MNKVEDDKYNFQSTQHFGRAFKNLQEQFESQQLCDVVLIAQVDGTRIPAHRNVLAASSEYFSIMFTGSLRESREKEIFMGEVYGDTLQALVTYCYTGTVELNEDNVATILATASLMQLDEVVNACFDFYMRNLYPSNCLSIAKHAARYNCIDGLGKLETFIHQYYIQISQTKEFLELSPGLLCKLIAHDEIAVQSEEDVFNSCLKWIQHDRINRERYIHQLMSLIRMPFLKTAFITKHIVPLCNSAECKDLISEAMQWHLKPHLRYELSASRTRPRKWSGGSLLALGRSQDNFLHIQSYCAKQEEWTKWHINLPYRHLFVAASLNDIVFIVEACQPSKPLGGFESIDLKSLKVATLRPLNTPRESMSCAVLDDYLYVVGGKDGANRNLNSVERWDSLTGTWSYVAAMKMPRWGACVAVLNKLLYAVGGGDALVHEKVECYDPSTNKWSSRAKMNMLRQWAGVAAGFGYLYAMGGWTGDRYTNSVERYDPVADKWTLLCSLNSARQQIGCAFLSQRLFAVGGHTVDKNWHATVEEYDFERNIWTRKNYMAESLGRNCLFNIPHMITPDEPNFDFSYS